MASPKDSPLLGAMAELALELLQDEAADRLQRLEQTPLGEMIREAQARRRKLAEEGRKATVEDVRDYVRAVTPIARKAADDRRNKE